VDNVRVWSISRFCIGKGYRKQSITSLLIAAALKNGKEPGRAALKASLDGVLNLRLIPLMRAI
jgi:hypothetical protein